MQMQPGISQTRQALNQFIVIISKRPGICDCYMRNTFRFGLCTKPNKISKLLFISWRRLHQYLRSGYEMPVRNK